MTESSRVITSLINRDDTKKTASFLIKAYKFISFPDVDLKDSHPVYKSISCIDFSSDYTGNLEQFKSVEKHIHEWREISGGCKKIKKDSIPCNAIFNCEKSEFDPIEFALICAANFSSSGGSLDSAIHSLFSIFLEILTDQFEREKENYRKLADTILSGQNLGDLFSIDKCKPFFHVNVLSDLSKSLEEYEYTTEKLEKKSDIFDDMIGFDCKMADKNLKLQEGNRNLKEKIDTVENKVDKNSDETKKSFKKISEELHKSEKVVLDKLDEDFNQSKRSRPSIYYDYVIKTLSLSSMLTGIYLIFKAEDKTGLKRFGITLFIASCVIFCVFILPGLLPDSKVNQSNAEKRIGSGESKR